MLVPRLSKYYNYRNLAQKGKTSVVYVWIDHSGIETRSKLRVVNGTVDRVEDLKDWSYDGSSTGQAETSNSEVVLKPVKLYPDPFRGGDNRIVLCETYKWADQKHTELKPADTNFRHFAEKVHEKVKHQKIMFGLE